MSENISDIFCACYVNNFARMEVIDGSYRLSHLRNADNQRTPTTLERANKSHPRKVIRITRTKNVNYVFTHLYSFTASIFSLFALKMMLETSNRRTTIIFRKPQVHEFNFFCFVFGALLFL